MQSIVELAANHLASMPNQDLPIVQFLYDPNVLNCVALFPLAGRGTEFFSDTTSPTTMGVIDSPGLQVQVRYSDPINAFVLCEAIRVWLDQNPPSGYVMCFTTRDQPSNVTSPEDLASQSGPLYRFSCDFSLTKVR